jgi:hypothetical protein
MIALLAFLAGGIAVYAVVRGVAARLPGAADHPAAGPVSTPEPAAREPAVVVAQPVVVPASRRPGSAPKRPVGVTAKPVSPVKSAAPAPTASASSPASTQGGQSMSKLQRIMELQVVVKGDSSAGKTATKAEQAELQRLAAEVAAELKQPAYPLGMEATFSGKWVKILKAWQVDGKGPWSYQIDAKLGLFMGLGDGTHTVTEEEIRQRLTDALGPMAPGQAYARGVTVMRNGKGGLIQTVTQDPRTGEFCYQLQGWPNAVAQSELTAIMRAA